MSKFAFEKFQEQEILAANGFDQLVLEGNILGDEPPTQLIGKKIAHIPQIFVKLIFLKLGFLCWRLRFLKLNSPFELISHPKISLSEYCKIKYKRIIIIFDMVLPLFKVLSLVIRVFSKPLINRIKQVHLKKDAAASHPYLRKGFVSLGNSYHKAETWINRKFMKIETQFAFKPLNDQLAIEKGIQFFYEIVFYSIVIGLPLYEMINSSNQAKVKAELLQQRLKSIDQRLEVVMEKERLREERRNVNKSPSQLNTIIASKQKIQNQTSDSLVKNEKQQQKPQQSADRITPFPYQSIKLGFPHGSQHIYQIYFQSLPKKEDVEPAQGAQHRKQQAVKQQKAQTKQQQESPPLATKSNPQSESK